MMPFFASAMATKAGDNSTTRSDGRAISMRIGRLSVENERPDSIRWGWSRSETERLVRMQAVVRGWLLRKKACRIPARDVEAVLKDLHHKEKGLGKLVRYLLFIVLFYIVVILETDVTFQYSVGQGLRDVVESFPGGLVAYGGTPVAMAPTGRLCVRKEGSLGLAKALLQSISRAPEIGASMGSVWGVGRAGLG